MKKPFLAVATAALLAALTGNVQAASQDECSIWLCLPGGFPSGCAAAHSAMISRIKDLKPPLPDFDSCAVNPPQGSGSHMSYKMGVAAFVPTHKECTQWNYWNDTPECVKWQTIPAHYVENTSCQTDQETGQSHPAYCTTTKRWVKVYVESAQTGDTYYW